jgi:hypothetical protein
MGGGGLFGAAMDYVAFLQMMLSGGKSKNGAVERSNAYVAGCRPFGNA